MEDYDSSEDYLSDDELFESCESEELLDGQEDLEADDELYEDGMDEIRGWIGEVNPNYDPYDLDSPYGSNCGSCAAAVWDRFSGYESAVATDETLSAEEMEERIGCSQIESTPQEIEEYVRGMGPGGHAVVGIDRVNGPGHWFNAYTPDGKHVYYVDGQSGDISGWPPNDLGEVSKWDVSEWEEES